MTDKLNRPTGRVSKLRKRPAKEAGRDLTKGRSPNRIRVQVATDAVAGLPKSKLSEGQVSTIEDPFLELIIDRHRNSIRATITPRMNAGMT